MARRIRKNAQLIMRLLAAMLLAGVCGCRGTATVRGKISYQGRPVTYGSVIFLSSDRTARSGIIETDSSYSVEGVHPGEVKIGVISHNPSKVLRVSRPQHRGEQGVTAAKTAIKNWFPLPRKLEDPEKSGLVCVVGLGEVDYNLDLK